MINAFLISFRLRIACRVNGILYWLKRLPLLRRILPGSLYGAGWLKTAATILAAQWELFSFFFGKILYLAVFFGPALALLHSERDAAWGGTFLHIFLFLTLAGALFNNPIFSADANTYYTVFLMRMDARRYALSNYVYFLLKNLLGFAGVLTPAWLLSAALLKEPAASPWWILLLPLLVVACKLIAAAGNLALFHRRGILLNDLSGGKPYFALLFLLLLAAYGLPCLGLIVPGAVLLVLCCILILVAVPAVLYLHRSRDYRRVYQAYPYAAAPAQAVQQAVQQGYQNKLVLEEGQGSQHSGCAYLNDLFIQRHRKMLVRRPRRLALILCGVLAAALLASALSRDLAAEINQRLIRTLPSFLLVMYFINRGETITQIMFFNCDHSLLAYRFYRRPQVILELFRARLRTVISLNLLPTAVIAAGLPLLLLVSGGTERPVEYPLLAGSILTMSVFFSVHYLVLYYLLQPYTAGLEKKSPAYAALTGVTYLVCYFVATRLGSLMSPLLFGVVLILFCAAYLPIALLLAYRLAPKTFRLRQ